MIRGLEERFQVLYLDERSANLGEVISSKTGIKVVETLYRCAGRVGLSASELSERVGAPRTTILHHLYKLTEAGLVEVHPLLRRDIDWKRFWSEAARLDLSRAEADRLRRARISGEKLFLPVKEGVILIPESVREAEAKRRPLREAVAAIGSSIGLAGALILLREYVQPIPKVRLAEATPQTSTISLLGLTLIAIAAAIDIVWLILTLKVMRKSRRQYNSNLHNRADK
ncbi:MAG: winged helix-turn-helix domain-containing protein [Candidatus Bathyarchaeia archaeon]